MPDETLQEIPNDPVIVLALEILATIYKTLDEVCDERVAQLWMTNPETRLAILDHLLNEHLSLPQEHVVHHMLKSAGVLAIMIVGPVAMEHRSERKEEKFPQISLENFDGELQA